VLSAFPYLLVKSQLQISVRPDEPASSETGRQAGITASVVTERRN